MRKEQYMNNLVKKKYRITLQSIKIQTNVFYDDDSHKVSKSAVHKYLKQISGVAYINLRKDFDTVDHELLLAKLVDIGCDKE